MRNRRLGRLALLTQGAALVGLGMTQLACGKDAAPPSEPLPVSSPPMPRPEDASAPPDTPPTTNAPMSASDAGAGMGVGRPILNAPPKKLPPAPSAKP